MFVEYRDYYESFAIVYIDNVGLINRRHVPTVSTHVWNINLLLYAEYTESINLTTAAEGGSVGYRTYIMSESDLNIQPSLLENNNTRFFVLLSSSPTCGALFLRELYVRQIW